MVNEFLTKVAKQFEGEGAVFSTNVCWVTGYSRVKE